MNDMTKVEKKKEVTIPVIDLSKFKNFRIEDVHSYLDLNNVFYRSDVLLNFRIVCDVKLTFLDMSGPSKGDIYQKRVYVPVKWDVKEDEKQ
jgi:hypothetical protein